MSGMTKTPKLHAKPSLMAAVVVYYGSLIAGEPIDLNESENVFHELGVNVDVLRRYINLHNKEIKESGCPSEIVSLLTQTPKLKDPGIRRKIEMKIRDMPDVKCQRCGHQWKSRSRYGSPVTRCHKCNARVDVREKIAEALK